MTESSPSSATPVPPTPLAPHRGTMILVFGILAIPFAFCCGIGLIFGVLALIFALLDLKKMDQGLMNPEGRGTTKTGLILAIIGLAIVVLLFIVGLIRGFSAANPMDWMNSSSPPSGRSERSLPSKTAAANEPYEIGDEIQLKDHTLVVNDVAQNFKSSNMFDEPESGNQYVIVNVTITNTDDDDLLVNDFGFKLEDASGVKRMSAMIAGLKGNLESATLAPGGSITGNIGFEAQKDSSVLKLHYEGNMFTKKAVVVDLLK